MSVWLNQHRDALGSALRRLMSAPLNTVLSLLAIGIALALPACGQMLMSNVLQLARTATSSPQISVFMKLDADHNVVSRTEEQLKKYPGVNSVKFTTSEQTLTRMKMSEGLGDVIAALQKNPFPDTFVVTPDDDRPDAMEGLANALRRLPAVEHVQLDSAWAKRLEALLRLGRTGVNLLAAFLGVGLVAITFNTIRLQVLTHQAEVEISRLLGATDRFIARPFYYFGLLQGLSGGLVAWLIVFVAAATLRGPVGELANLYGVGFGLVSLGTSDTLLLLGLAALLGWVGAALSVHQHMRGT